MLPVLLYNTNPALPYTLATFVSSRKSELRMSVPPGAKYDPLLSRKWNGAVLRGPKGMSIRFESFLSYDDSRGVRSTYSISR